MIRLYVASWSIFLTILPRRSLVMLPSPLTQRGEGQTMALNQSVEV